MTDIDHSTRYDLMASDQVPADEIAAWLKEPGFAAYVAERQGKQHPILEGMQEALAVAKGEQPAARIWIKGHAYVPEAISPQPAPSADAVIEQFPLADANARDGGWTYDPEWLFRIAREAQEATGYDCTAEVVQWLIDELGRSLASTIPAAEPARACTCHPEDNPPIPCAHKYAYSECVGASSQPARETEAEKKLRQCQWYWPEDDTRSETCADSPQEVVDNIYGWNGKDGDVIAVARGGIVEVTYCASLPPAEDSDSDDEFWVQEATEEAAQAKIGAEQARRAALRAGEQP